MYGCSVCIFFLMYKAVLYILFCFLLYFYYFLKICLCCFIVSSGTYSSWMCAHHDVPFTILEMQTQVAFDSSEIQIYWQGNCSHVSPYLGSGSELPGMHSRWGPSRFILEDVWIIFKTFLGSVAIILWVSYYLTIFRDRFPLIRIYFHTLMNSVS